MTTMNSDERPLPWWHWIGPWPLRPVPIGIATAVFTFVSTAYALTAESLPWRIALAAAVGVLVGLPLWIARRVHPAGFVRLSLYIGFIALITMPPTILRFATDSVPAYPRLNMPGAFVLTAIFSAVFILLFLAILGASQSRLVTEVRRADAAVTALEQQSAALLAADEETRRQVALLLHDRVQAGLVSTCLQLRRALGGDPPRDEIVSRVVHQLEELRSIDVRRAVHALSPNLREVDLVTAIEVLGQTYEPALQVTCTMEPDSELTEQQMLGVYRIVEQCLLNSAMHGQATQCHVAITHIPSGIHVDITDNGSGITGPVQQGFGTTLIDTWCRTLGAVWSLQPQGQGAIVSVVMPARTPNSS